MGNPAEGLLRTVAKDGVMRGRRRLQQQFNSSHSAQHTPFLRYGMVEANFYITPRVQEGQTDGAL